MPSQEPLFSFFSSRGQKSLVIYPISGNNATQKIDFTDRENEVSCNLFYVLVGSEMIDLPSRINVRRINLNKKFSRSSRPVLLNFSEIHRKTLVFVSLFNKVAAGQVPVTLLKRDFSAGVFLSLRNFYEHIFQLLLVLQVYLHQIINLNKNLLKVFQVSLQLFVGQRLLRMQKVKNFGVPPSLPMHAYPK